MAKGAVMTPKEFKVELRKIAAEIGKMTPAGL